MSDLVERVTAALRNPGDSPWLPGLATALAEHGWANLYNDIGLPPSEYGTMRVMARDRNAPRKIASVIPAALCDKNSAQMFQVELLDKDTARRYEEAGVRFYSEGEIKENGMSARVADAINILKGVPTLFLTVAELVRTIHLIDAGDEDYDVSFSEPNIPFTIFVSVPHLCSVINTLRITEALVHEAMHLQLTLVERLLTLTKQSDGRYFSPWRDEYRTARGILHALYVFRVIDCFFGELLKKKLISSKYFEYLHERKHEIACQANEVREFSNCQELTDVGKNFVNSLLFKVK